MEKDYKFRAYINENWNLIKNKYLDSGIESCTWHRIVLDAHIPENSSITIEYSISDSNTDFNYSDSITFTDANDALLLSPVNKGRYIRLKMSFNSKPGVTILLRQVRVYYQRNSYLRYLPAFFQENPGSRDFLERYLSLFESSLFDSEELISNISMFFDPMAAPDGFVEWLASWMSLDLYELLGDKNREFILRATEFYKKKGTVPGLDDLVTFLTGKKCIIREYKDYVFRTWGMDPELDIGDPDICRDISTTVDTNNLKLLTDIDTFKDTLHYTADTGEEALYFRDVIGLYIVLKLEESFEMKEEELHNIINSFLPVFVRVRIIIAYEEQVKENYNLSWIEEYFEDSVNEKNEEQYDFAQGVYTDTPGWSWITTFDGSSPVIDVTNSIEHRSMHDMTYIDFDI